MHGHTYVLTVTVSGPVDEHTGWVVDFADIKTAVNPLIARLDHRLLNDIIPNPTAENQVKWLWEHLDLPGLSLLTLREGLENTVSFDGTVEAA
jgi:6-pyruvoyltetrahydropterin/6-carboxytetrahydropterin synthase